jgi:hypothetical protein
LARRSIVESLVWPDAVVDVAEAGGLHRERAAVVDRGAVEVLVLQSMTADAPDPAARCLDSLKSVCQTRLRSVGGSSKTLRRSVEFVLRPLRADRRPSN